MCTKGNKKKSDNFILKNRLRITAFVAAVLLLFCAPALTEAKYKWTLNAFNAANGAEYYFTSNLMDNSTDGKTSTFSGWNGVSPITTSLNLKNYQNALLYNKSGQDVLFTFSYKAWYHSKALNTDTALDTLSDYKFAPTNLSASGMTFVGSDDGTWTYTGSLAGGSPILKTLNFDLTNEKGQSTMAEGDYIWVQMNAANSTDEQFYSSLSGKLIYKLADVNSFVTLSVDDNTTDMQVAFQIQTNNIPSSTSATATVVVWWDTTLYDINTFNKDYAIVYGTPGSIGTVSGTNIMYMKIPLGSGAERNFEFYKQGAYAPATAGGAYTKVSELDDDKNYEYIAENSSWSISLAEGSIKHMGYYVDSSITPNSD